ncbi:MAG: cytochrome c biogenesis protein ResB [Elusimicrobia bacterium]|nr:cytochrome c biogenesis protein ResB [Elusimicrobiota bacterium]
MYDYFRKTLNTLSSIGLFLTLLIFILIACVLGGTILQNEAMARYHAVYGHAFGSLVVKLGLDHVFDSWWFLLSLGLAAANLLACLWQRYQVFCRRPGLLISHLAIILIFAGGIVRGLTAKHGYLALNAGEASGQFFTGENQAHNLPFWVRLKDFRVQYWKKEAHRFHVLRQADGRQTAADIEAGQEITLDSLGLKIKAAAFYPNFVMGHDGPATRDMARENPAMALIVYDGKKRIQKFVFANFPDFHGNSAEKNYQIRYEYIPGKIRQFESVLEIFDAEGSNFEKTISVNNPLKHRGWRFYQSGYDPKNPAFSSLQVARDPSVTVIYLAFILLPAGLAWSFWFSGEK